ncbi:MAG: heat-inducible transcriptional repressor HrcA [Eubacterium sp.]|nr:heat-inducible transcriptional repressor HrcA [Eubacterium sp.]
MIGERQAAILSIIIDSYIKTGEPIGSKTLASLLPYRISSATIRNEMAYLSELGFLEQMHTSGGRIPSKASYRYYVNNLLVSKELTDYEKAYIIERLSVNAGDPERLLHDAATLLADTTHCAAFFNTIKDEFDSIQGVDLIPAGNGKAMLVMLTVGGKIKSSVCRLDCPVDSDFKSIFYYLMSEYFIGTPLTDVNIGLIQSTVPVLGARAFDMLPVLTSLCSLCREASESTLYVDGETNLFSHEELGNGVYRLLSFLAAKDHLKQIMEEYAKHGKETELLIGNENYHYELKNTTTALAKFNYNNSQTAVLGIIGSTRIDYASILPRVEYIMKTVKEFLQKGGVTFE